MLFWSAIHWGGGGGGGGARLYGPLFVYQSEIKLQRKGANLSDVDKTAENEQNLHIIYVGLVIF